MLRCCKILNKETNELFYGQIDEELEGQDFYPLIEVAEDFELPKPQAEINAEAQKILDETDYKIIRENELRLVGESKMTDEQLKELHKIRQEARSKIVL